MARVTMTDDPTMNGRALMIEIERQFDPRTDAGILREGLKEAAKQFAEKWIEDNRDKIMERLNVDAIANMIMIEVANDIKNEVRGKK